MTNNKAMNDLIEAFPHNPEGDNFDFKASLESVKNSIVAHIQIVIVVTVLTIVFVMTYISLWPPVFEASVVVTADSDEDIQRASFYQTWNIFRRQSPSDEAILMASDPVLRTVIEDLDLQYHEVYHPFMSQVVHIWGESWVGRNYRRLKYSLFPQDPLPEGLTEEMVERYKVLADFRAGVSVVPIGNSNVSLLRVRGPSPRVAEVANKTIDVYLEERRNRYVDEAEKAVESLSGEVRRAYGQLMAVENELNDFYTQNSLLLNFEKDRTQLTQWLNLEAEIMDLKTQEAQLSETLRILDSQLKNESAVVGGVSLFQDSLMALKAQRTQLEIAIRQKEQRFHVDSPEMQDLYKQMAVMDSIIDEQETLLAGQEAKSDNQFYESIRSQIAQARSSLAGTKAAIGSKQLLFDEMQPLMAELPDKMQITNDLQRQQQLLESQYRLLNDKLVQASISATTARTAPSAIHVIDYAAPPEKAVWPRTKLMLIAALLVGGILGVICALTLDMILVRVTRQKLSGTGRQEAYAILEQDDRFIEAVYALDR